ncbi:hypothetical protein J2X36_000816 [Methylobacterium sp. BE186]|uniref:Cache 3/Cache 2 fusion domain-containing protein n=1 Tax=Methylobacterium sp. BE186 TaxID=2817715 RepID=UPI002855400E|nr:Cache 3/Cache 2 fusion domain-containing protein [Methylobacterium sp. BE186]MDR7036080.1 hypothetical protein [Methylobacterium sp. BE186]
MVIVLRRLAAKPEEDEQPRDVACVRTSPPHTFGDRVRRRAFAVQRPVSAAPVVPAVLPIGPSVSPTIHPVGLRLDDELGGNTRRFNCGAKRGQWCRVCAAAQTERKRRSDGEPCKPQIGHCHLLCLVSARWTDSAVPFLQVPRALLDPTRRGDRSSASRRLIALVLQLHHGDLHIRDVCDPDGDPPSLVARHALQRLKSKAAELGSPELKGEYVVAGRPVPDLYVGETRMHGTFPSVDDVQTELGGTAALFVKSSGAFVLVATSVKRADGSRSGSPIQDPQGPAMAAIAKGYAYSGEADIQGRTYTTRYEPIRTLKKDVIGIFYVAYPKR